MNSVNNLLLKNFSLCSIEEKLEIKKLGRSTPLLNIEQIIKSKNRQFKRFFNLSIYDKHKWICGCEERNSLHCFPCLLFSGEDTWTKTGVRDINHLTSKANYHENTKVHMKNALSLSLFGKVNIAKTLDSAYRKSIYDHNEKIKKNRYILNIIINCIKFCGAFELALRGHSETESSTNPGVFRGLVNFSAELDNSLKVHLEEATVFKGISKTIQNELLQIMLEICHEEIIREIHEADFLSVIADETSDISNIFQMVVIFRYIVKGKPIERFWNFIAPEKHDAETLTTCLLEEIEKLGIKDHKDKLISQTYDGANVMKGSSGGVQAKLRKMYPKAEYIHCHAHQLNLVMLNAASINRNVRMFFANLQAICAFFSTTPKRTAVLNQIVNRRLPRSIPTKWNFHSRSVNTVFENKEEIKECLKVILNGDEFQDLNTISLASGHAKILESNNFNFWISFFHKIMPSVDFLYGQLQKRNIDPSSIKICIDNFERKVLSIRENFNYEESAHNVANRRETGISDLSREAKEICDTIICQIKDRFKFTGHLIAATLFLPEKFDRYNSKFPTQNFNTTCKEFPFLNIKKLQTELTLIYSTEEFHLVFGAVGFLDFVSENNLEDTFSECVKILKVLITIPMTTSEADRCFSTLKRIKTFTKNTMREDKLSALAMLSVEKDFVMSIWDFNHKVIDKFAQLKERRADFLFK